MKMNAMNQIQLAPRLIAFILSCGRVCFDAEKQTRQQTILSLRIKSNKLLVIRKLN